MVRRFVGLLVLISMLSLALAACGDSPAAPTSVPAATKSSGGAAATTSGATTTTAGNSNSNPGSDLIAAPGSASAVTTSADFSKATESGYLKAMHVSGGFQFNYYATNDTADNLLAYYDSALAKAGFTTAPSQTLPTRVGATSVNVTVKIYLQAGADGKYLYQIGILGPLDATTIQTVGGGLQAGQSLLFTTYGKTSTADSSSATTAASDTATSGNTSSVSPTATQITPYSGLTAISSPDLFSQSFEATVRKGANSNISGFQFSYFTTPDSGDKVFAYYDDTVPQAGYTKQGVQSQAMPMGSTSINATYHAYLQKTGTSGGQIYEVAVFGPLDAATAQGMRTGNTNTYNEGDSVVVIVQCVVAGS